MIGISPFIQPGLKQYASGMHKCIPYAKSGALPLDEPGRLSERAERINPLVYEISHQIPIYRFVTEIPFVPFIIPSFQNQCNE